MARAELAAIVGHLDQYLRIREVPDEPGAVNGLQVENEGRIGGIVAAVDGSLATIEGAVAIRNRLEAPALLLVHHGLFWDGNLPVAGRRYRRLAAAIRGDLAIYAAHIPLDIHPEVGNNAVLATGLGLIDQVPFDNYRGAPLGVAGTLPEPEPREALVARLESIVGSRARLLPGGPVLSRRVGVITGGAGSRIRAAVEAGLDTFITGEGAHHTYFDAIELGINVVYAGHYATEQVGVKALAERLGARFDLPWEFHDHPTGL